MTRTNSPSWMRSPLDHLDHAYRHYVEASDAGRRQALIGFDQAIEVVIHSYAQESLDDEFARDRAFQQKFVPKVDFLKAHLASRGLPFQGSYVGIKYRHRLRNRVVHRPGWYVPSLSEVEAGRRDAVAVFDCLAPVGASARCPRLAAIAAVAAERLPSASGGRTPRAVAREFEALAIDFAQRFDPDRDGVHFREVADEIELGARRLTAGQVYWLLNSAQDRFDAMGDGMFRWRDVEPDSSGISARHLAKVAYPLAKRADPERHGLHYDRDLKRLVIEAGYKVAGRPPGKTMNTALRAAPDLFELDRTPGRRSHWLWREPDLQQPEEKLGPAEPASPREPAGRRGQLG